MHLPAMYENMFPILYQSSTPNVLIFAHVIGEYDFSEYVFK